MALIANQQPLHTSPNSSSKNYLPALLALAILYFMMGFITVLNDTLVPFFKEGFTLSYSQSSLVQFYFFLTYGLISIPAGKVIEKIGYKKGMVAGFVIASFGAFLFFPASFFHQYALFLAALFVVAIGIVMLQVAANPYITVLGPPETAASRLTLIQGIGSMGTTVAPIFGAHFILSKLHESGSSSAALVQPYLLIGTGLLLIGIIVWRLALPSIHTDADTSTVTNTDSGTITSADTSDMTAVDSSSKVNLFKYSHLKFGVIALFMYVGAEVAIGTFLTNYISDTVGIAEHAANLYLSFYWGGMLVGRFVGAYFLKIMKPQQVLTAVSALAALLIVVSIFSSGYIAVWTMVAVGLCNSIMFAVIFSLSVKDLGNLTTRASGYLSTAIVGGAIISYLQGLMKDHYTWQIAFIIPVLCYVFLIFYGLKGYKTK